MKLSRIFNGKMDVDSGDRFVQKGDYRLLENGIIDQQGGSNRYSVKNLKSTTEEVDLGLTDYVNIGKKIFKGVIYSFYNNGTLTRLYKIPLSTFTPVLLFSKDIDQDKTTKIKDIDFVEDLENDWILCYFNDTVNQPFKVNLTRLEADDDYYSTKEDMYVIKKPPFAEPQITMVSDPNKGETMRDKAFKFAYRYRYDDSELSSLSFHSRAAFSPLIKHDRYVQSAQISYFLVGDELYRSGSTMQNPYAVYDFSDELTGNRYIKSIATSQSGRVVVVGVGSSSETSHKLYISYNYGNSFIEKDSYVKNITSICMSYDAKYIHILTNESKIYTSSNYGNTFDESYAKAGEEARNIKCSIDGRNVIALTIENDGGTLHYHILTSGDFGSSFSQRLDTLSDIDSVSISANGRYSIGIGGSTSDGLILYSSDDLFLTNTKQTNSTGGWGTSGIYWDCEISNDLSKLYAIYVTTGGDTTIHQIDNIDATQTFAATTIYTFSGFNFTDYNVNTISLTASQDGEYILASTNHGVGSSAYSINGGVSFTAYSGADGCSTFNISSSEFVNLNTEYQNAINSVDIIINSGSTYVSGAEVYAIDTHTNTTYLIKDFDYSRDGISDDEDVSFTFDNADSYPVLSDKEVNMLYSNVPEKASSQFIINNRLCYGGYIDGNNGVDVDYGIVVSKTEYDVQYYTDESSDTSKIEYSIGKVFGDEFLSGETLVSNFLFVLDGETTEKTVRYVFNETETIFDGISAFADYIDGLSFVASTLIISQPFDYTIRIVMATGATVSLRSSLVRDKGYLSFKSGTSSEFGIIYYDDYNRSSQPLFDNGEVSFDRYDGNINNVEININSLSPIPSFATKYKICRKQPAFEYAILNGATEAYVHLGNIYIKVPSGVSVSVNDTLAWASDSTGVISSSISEIVRDVDTYELDFFATGSTRGTYMMIDAPNNDNYTLYNIINGDSKYFETVFYLYRNVDNTNNLYFECPGTYAISGGSHAVEDITLYDGDVFFVGGIEAYSIGGGGRIVNYGRPMIKTNNFKRLNRYASITWSEPYIDDIDYNGLSTFNLATANYVDLKKEYGSITGLHEHIGRLLVLQDDKIGVIEVNRSITSTADGAQQINLVDNFLHSASYNAYAGDWGSISDWAFTSFGNTKYMVDKKRKTIIRLSADGLTDISRYFMESYFNGLSTSTDKYDYIAAFNPENSEYWLYDDNKNEIVIHDEKAGGWTRLITDIELEGMESYNGIVYTFDGDKVYSHMTGSSFGSIHGEQKTFKLQYIENQESGYPKVHNSIELEANKPLDINISDKSIDVSIDDTDFENREGEYFAYVPMGGGSSLSDDDLESSIIKPLGEVDSNTTTVLSLKNSPPRDIRSSALHASGDVVYVYDSTGDSYSRVGEIASVSGNDLTMTFDATPTVDFYEDKFVFAVENSYINGRNVRGNTVTVEITDSGTEKVEIESVNINVMVSKND
jgi:hypothetical protein